MAIAFVGIGAETTGGMAGPTAIPAGSNGDLLVMFFHSDSGGTGTLTGWNAGNQFTSGTHTIGIIWRIRDGTEGSTATITGLSTSGAPYIETIIAAYSSADTTTPVNTFASAAGTATSPSITTSVANCWDVTAVSFDGGSSNSAAPGSYVRRLNGTGGYNLYIADLALTTATTYTGTSFAGNGGAGPNTMRFAIAPGAGGPSGTALPDAAPVRRRRLSAVRRARFMSVVPPPQVIAPGRAPQPARRPPRILTVRRARTTSPVPAQTVPVNPVFVPTRTVRARRLLPRIRARLVWLGAGQPLPPTPQPARTRRLIRVRRGQGTQVPPAQIVPVNPLWVPTSQAFTRRLRAVRRNRTAQPVPAQVTFNLSPYVQRPPRTPLRTLPFRRGRSTFVVPLQTAPPPPSFVPGTAARARRLLKLRRGRTSPHSASQPHPPIVQPARGRRLHGARRGRTSSPVPAQILLIAPSFAASIPRRVRRILAKARRRLFAPPFENFAGTGIIPDPNPEHVIIEQHSRVVIDQRSRVTIEQRSRYLTGE